MVAATASPLVFTHSRPKDGGFAPGLHEDSRELHGDHQRPNAKAREASAGDRSLYGRGPSCLGLRHRRETPSVNDPGPAASENHPARVTIKRQKKRGQRLRFHMLAPFAADALNFTRPRPAGPRLSRPGSLTQHRSSRRI